MLESTYGSGSNESYLTDASTWLALRRLLLHRAGTAKTLASTLVLTHPSGLASTQLEFHGLGALAAAPYELLNRGNSTRDLIMSIGFGIKSRIDGSAYVSKMGVDSLAKAGASTQSLGFGVSMPTTSGGAIPFGSPLMVAPGGAAMYAGGTGLWLGLAATNMISVSLPGGRRALWRPTLQASRFGAVPWEPLDAWVGLSDLHMPTVPIVMPGSRVVLVKDGESPWDAKY